jgi:hypothetical protein
MANALPLFVNIQEEFGKQIPDDLLVSIVAKCKPNGPVERTSPVKAKQPVGRGTKNHSAGRPPKASTAAALPSAESPDDKVDIDVSELGRAVVAFAWTLGYDLDTPPVA